MGTAPTVVQRSVLIYERGIYWFPWVGTQAMITLSLAADADALKRRSDFLALYYPSLTRDEFIEHLKRIAEGKIDPKAMAALLPEKRFERFDGFLRIPLKNKAFYRLHKLSDDKVVYLVDPDKPEQRDRPISR